MKGSLREPPKNTFSNLLLFVPERRKNVESHHKNDDLKTHKQNSPIDFQFYTVIMMGKLRQNLVLSELLTLEVLLT